MGNDRLNRPTVILDVTQLLGEAQALLAAGRYAEALPRWSQLAEVLGVSPFAAEVLLPLATCLWRTGDVERARRTYERLCGDSDMSVRARALLGLGNLLEDIDRIPEAEKAYEALVSIAGQIQDAPLWRRRALNGVGLIALKRKQYDKARSYFTEAVELARAAGDDMGLGNYLGNLAQVNKHEGALETALSLYYDAYKAHETAGQRNGMAHWRGAAAMILAVQQRPDDALAGFEEAAALHRQTGDVWGLHNDLRHIAEVAIEQRDYDRARRAIDELGTLPRKEMAMEVVRLRLSGTCHYYTGHYKAALADFQEAVERTADDPVLLPECLLDLAPTLRHLGRVGDAVAAYERAIAVHERTPLIAENASRFWLNYGILLDEDLRDLDGACRQFERVLDALEAGEEFMLDWESARASTAAHADVRVRLVETFVRGAKFDLAIRTIDSGSSLYIRQWSALLLPDALARPAANRDEYTRTVQRVRQLELAIKFARLDRPALFAQRTEMEEQLWRDLRAARERVSRLRGAAPTTAGLHSRQPTRTLIFYPVSTGIHLFAGEAPIVHAHVTESDLFDCYHEWVRTELASDGVPGFHRQRVLDRVVDSLRRHLSAPLDTFLSKARATPDATTLLIPHSFLTALPLHAVLPAHCARVTHAQSRSLYDQICQRPVARIREALIVVNPTGDLPHTQEECKQVTAHLQRAGIACKILAGNDATPQAFLDGLHQVQILHFAGHASFNLIDPLRSALFFAAGPLTLRELLTSIDARGLALAILSACQSAAPEIHWGQDNTGLATGFLASGCRTVIGSLWKVADHSTAVLMSRFYEHWAANERVDEALARAVQHTKTMYPHPLHWAPFLVLGDGALRPTAGTQPN
jgi:CHAT domain-containing protein/Flp pilus assembly protein TadD